MTDFLAAINDAELRREIVDVLTKMQLLAEVRASSIELSSGSSEKPAGPPGFIGLSEKHCPPEDRSLYEHFVWRFRHEVAANRSKKRLWFLLWEAQKAYDMRATPASPENPRTALVLTRANEKALIEHILDDHEGEHAVKVAINMSLPEGWIKKIREDNDCEPEYGHRRPKWRELDDRQKRDVVASLRRDGLTQREAAKWLGIHRNTVNAYDDPTPAA